MSQILFVEFCNQGAGGRHPQLSVLCSLEAEGKAEDLFLGACILEVEEKKECPLEQGCSEEIEDSQLAAETAEQCHF